MDVLIILVILDVEYEIFNSTATELSSKLNNKYLHDLMVVKYGINYKSIITSKFYEILIYLKKICNKEFLIFKCFLNHLDSKKIKYLIDNKIIHYTFILERTNIIDKFISLQKVRIHNSWSQKDTSNIQINFNISEYEKYKKKHIKIYDTFSNLVKNTKYTYFKYNDIVDITDFVNKILDILPKLQVNYEINNLQIFTNKQDNEENYSKKIKNYNDIKNYFKDELKNLT